MAREELMQQLPEDVENVEIKGPFKIRRYLGSTSVIVLTGELVTCGGIDGKDRASELASALNEVWNKQLENFSQRMSSDPEPEEKNLIHGAH